MAGADGPRRPRRQYDRVRRIAGFDAARAEPSGMTVSWPALRQATPARIGLGRSGTALTTAAQLDFQLAHARARDAVHAALDAERIAGELGEMGLEALQLRSAAADRATYLRRPD